MNGIAEQKHSPDGKKCGGADAASCGGPLVMQVVRCYPSQQASLDFLALILSNSVNVLILYGGKLDT